MKTTTGLTIISQKVKGSKTIRINVYTPKEIEAVNNENKFNRIFDQILQIFNLKRN